MATRGIKPFSKPTIFRNLLGIALSLQIQYSRVRNICPSSVFPNWISISYREGVASTSIHRLLTFSLPFNRYLDDSPTVTRHTNNLYCIDVKSIFGLSKNVDY